MRDIYSRKECNLHLTYLLVWLNTDALFLFLFQAVVTYSSTYVLVALSVDRYYAIKHPMNFSGSCKYEPRDVNRGNACVVMPLLLWMQKTFDLTQAYFVFGTSIGLKHVKQNVSNWRATTRWQRMQQQRSEKLVFVTLHASSPIPSCDVIAKRNFIFKFDTKKGKFIFTLDSYWIHNGIGKEPIYFYKC